jgi:hypothetical protein
MNLSQFARAALLALLLAPAATAQESVQLPADAKGLVSVASLIYANDKTAVCFSSHFLQNLQEKTSVRTDPQLRSVSADSLDLFNYPFAVMTGEKSFILTDAQRTNLRDYLEAGGFLVASAGCSSREWSASFRDEIARIFPDRELKVLDKDHPVFSTVYTIRGLKTKRQASNPHLEGLEIDGRIALIFSEDGLNDTAHAGGSCCCCGGDEITNARDVNVNLLAYALTH